MDRTPVESASIKEIGYDPTSQTLEIKFANGGVYQHHDVPPEKHQAFLSAESVGRYFHTEIRGKHRHTRLENV